MNSRVKGLILRAKHEAKYNWLKAINTLYDAHKIDPNEVVVYNELGDIYFSRELYDKAAENYRSAVRINEHNTDVIFKLAYCYLLTKDFERSICYFDLISDFIPEAAYNKCIALCQLNRNEQAIDCLEELIINYPCSEKPFLLLARLYMELERYHKVIEVLNAAENFFPTTPEIFHLRGIACFNAKKWLQAYLDFNKADTYSISLPLFFRMYALTSEKIGNTEKAIGLLKRSIDEYPRFFAAYYDLIKIYTIHCRYQEAFAVAEKLSKHGLTLDDISRYDGFLFKRVFESNGKNRDRVKLI